MWWLFPALAVVAVVGWALRQPARRRRASARGEIDRDALDAAEREVHDLDVMTSPDEADDHLPDWGPGAPSA